MALIAKYGLEYHHKSNKYWKIDCFAQRLRDLALLPRYRPILVWENRLAQTIDGPEKARELDESIAAIEQAVRVVGTAKTTDDVRAAIAPFRPATQYPLI